MRKKNIKNKRYACNEFRFNYTHGHMNYIFEEDGKKYHSLGLTHHQFTKDKNKKWRKNMPLTKNPEKGDNQPSYIRYGVISDKKNNYYHKPSGKFTFTSEDLSRVKSKIRNYKNRRKKRK